jgi:hypothetical protein
MPRCIKSQLPTDDSGLGTVVPGSGVAYWKPGVVLIHKHFHHPYSGRSLMTRQSDVVVINSTESSIADGDALHIYIQIDS